MDSAHSSSKVEGYSDDEIFNQLRIPWAQSVHLDTEDDTDTDSDCADGSDSDSECSAAPEGLRRRGLARDGRKLLSLVLLGTWMSLSALS